MGQFDRIDKKSVNVFLSYFVRGVLTIVPFAMTWYIMVLAVTWIDGIIKIKIPGLGVILSVSFITLIGYLTGSFFVKSIFDSIESSVLRIPGVSTIYSYIKDLILAVLDKKMKFDRPVLIITNMDNQTRKIGFIANDDLRNLNLCGQVAVYVPQSYSFSGELFIIPKENIVPIEGVSGTTMLKFVIAGGIIDTKKIRIDENEALTPQSENVQ